MININHKNQLIVFNKFFMKMFAFAIKPHHIIQFD